MQSTAWVGCVARRVCAVGVALAVVGVPPAARAGMVGELAESDEAVGSESAGGSLAGPDGESESDLDEMSGIELGDESEGELETGPEGETLDDQVEVDVHVASGIVKGAELTEWIEADMQQTLVESPSGFPRRGKLRVDVSGELYDYSIRITAYPEDEETPEPSEWTCECSNEELLEKLSVELEKASVLLQIEPELEPIVVPRKKPKPLPVEASLDDVPVKKKPEPKAVVGAVAMVLGMSGIATGVTFIALGEVLEDKPGAVFYGDNFRPPGVIAAGAGAGLFVAGVAFLLASSKKKRKHRRTAGVVVPSVVGRGSAALSVSGRF